MFSAARMAGDPTVDSPAGANRTNIEYGEAGGQKLMLDAHVPAGDGKFPVLLIVHGGGWSGGDKATDIVPVLAAAAKSFTLVHHQLSAGTDQPLARVL